MLKQAIFWMFFMLGWVVSEPLLNQVVVLWLLLDVWSFECSFINFLNVYFLYFIHHSSSSNFSRRLSMIPALLYNSILSNLDPKTNWSSSFWETSNMLFSIIKFYMSFPSWKCLRFNRNSVEMVKNAVWYLEKSQFTVFTTKEGYRYTHKFKLWWSN